MSTILQSVKSPQTYFSMHLTDLRVNSMFVTSDSLKTGRHTILCTFPKGSNIITHIYSNDMIIFVWEPSSTFLNNGFDIILIKWERKLMPSI